MHIVPSFETVWLGRLRQSAGVILLSSVFESGIFVSSPPPQLAPSARTPEQLPLPGEAPAAPTGWDAAASVDPAPAAPNSARSMLNWPRLYTSGTVTALDTAAARPLTIAF